MPHITSTGTSLHRTAKSARLDIYQEGQHHDALVRFEARAMLERQIGKWYLHLPDSHTSPRAAEKLEAAPERILRRL